MSANMIRKENKSFTQKWLIRDFLRVFIKSACLHVYASKPIDHQVFFPNKEMFESLVCFISFQLLIIRP